MAQLRRGAPRNPHGTQAGAGETPAGGAAERAAAGESGGTGESREAAAAAARAKAMASSAAAAASANLALGGSSSTSGSSSTPAWMSEMMELEEETGLTCMVCHEGYKCKVRKNV